MTALPPTIELTLTATDAAAVVCGLGLVVAMLGGEDADPPDSVLATMNRLTLTDALWICEKVKHAVETQVMGMET